ncbi:hypothetical protein DYB32_008257 [Aphanomyces invadans]|uniref:Uncharacterized protein n=1 Tax=Aphanomyces invadans TaxID=157072 RepID=A0A3R6ZSX4_9STRA|nr:hypothetical protein DYB32_008257 [Aphanomyces invadans]
MPCQVSVLLATAQKDQNRTCRIEALRTLTAAVRAIDDADVLTQMFPGLMSSLFQIVQSDYKLGSKLPTQAIRCLSITMTLVLQDTRCPSLVTKPSYSLAFLGPDHPTLPASSSTSSSSPPRSPSLTPKSLDRTPAWLDATRSNLLTLVVSICGHQRYHSNALVRQALTSFCVDLLVHCRLTLSECILPCYETVLALAQDPIDVGRQVAIDGLGAVHAVLSPSEQLLLHTNAGERCMAHLTSLMQKCAAPPLDFEREAVATLQVCLGYVTTCQEKWVVDIDRVINAWTHILAVDAVDVHVLAYTTYAPNAAYFRTRFEHFRSDDAVAVACQVVRCFGATSDFPAYVDAIVAHVMAFPTDSMEWLVVFNQLVLGAARTDLPALSSAWTPQKKMLDIHVGAYLVDVVLQLPLWTPTEGCDESMSILVEIVGSIAQALAAAFCPLLMHVLYPLVEQLGRPSPIVQQAALATLARLAYSCNFHSSVPKLLHANMDYVVDMLVSRLNQLDEYPHTPFVVEALLRHGGSSATSPLPLLEEAVAGVIRSVDIHVATPQHAIGLLRVMKVVVTNEPTAPCKPLQRSTAASSTSTWTSPSRRVTSFIHDMKNLFDPPDDDIAAPADDDVNMPRAGSTKGAMPIEHNEHASTSPPTGMAKLVQDIVLRSTYFTAARDTETACSAWQVLTQALAVVPSEHIRPLVHRIWPQLAQRVGDSTHKPKHLAAVQCLSALAGLCGDFIGDKFVESVWPAFETHFKHHASESMQHGALALDDLQFVVDEAEQTDAAPSATSSALQRPTSLTNQIHLHMITCLERVCRSTDSVAFLVHDIADATQPFLASTAPPPLQDQTVALFHALMRLNGDLLFPRLVSMASMPLPPPPSIHFPVYAPDAVLRTSDCVPHPALYARNGRRLFRSLHAPLN